MANKQPENIPTIVEARDVNEANAVPMEFYRFERFSEQRNAYIFVKRGRR